MKNFNTWRKFLGELYYRIYRSRLFYPRQKHAVHVPFKGSFNLNDYTTSNAPADLSIHSVLIYLFFRFQQQLVGWSQPHA